jgi:membrane protein YdbS with pleckstrin-like domain
MRKESETTTSGISFSGVLLIVFVVLKLIGVINWSWWWVLSPFWIPFSIIIVILLIIFILNTIGTIKEKKRLNRINKNRS